jgi:hypothetical protein
MMKKPTTLIFILLGSLCVMLFLKLSIILSRQFDPDEFAYLHWAYLLANGKLPYRDFFFYIIPVFPGFLAPLFLLPATPAIVLVGRLLMFGVYLLTLWLLFFLVKSVTKHLHTALLALLIFIAFPLTFDKTIEIRPDMVMTFLFLISTVLLVKNTQDNNWVLPRVFPRPTFSSRIPTTWFQMFIDHINTLFPFFQKKGSIVRDSVRSTGVPQRASPIPNFLSGFFFSLSFLTMFKIVFAVPAILFLLLIGNKKPIRALFLFLVGSSLPILLFFFYLLGTNLIPQCLTALTHDASIVNVGNSSFSLFATLSPWPLIYVNNEGVSFPWLVSTALWILMIPGLYLMLKHRQTMGVFFGILLVSSVGFLYLFPKPYVQYFIIPSMVAAIATAVLVMSVFKKQIWIVSVFSFLLLVSFGIQTLNRQSPLGSNQEQLDVLRDVLTAVKPDEPVYDMVGSYVFRPDGYYICCHPYIQFSHLLNRPIPTLTQSLIATKTKFLVLDQKGYVFWIAKPEDLEFMTTHYLPSSYNKIYALGSQFQCSKGSCIQLNVHGNPVSENPKKTLTIVIEDQYKITIQPDNQHITINNTPYANSQTVSLLPGIYQFSVPPTVSYFSIQLNR